MLILGVHCSYESHVLDDKSKTKTISEAIKRDTDILNLNAAQIFTAGPQTYNINKLDYKDIIKVCQHIDLTVHGPYLMAGVWKIHTDNKEESTIKAAITKYRKVVQSCSDIDAWGLVIHLNKAPANQLADSMSVLLPIARELEVTILLEMTAVKASKDTYELGSKLDNLINEINAALKKHHPESYTELEKWYGITVDTAHLWGAGVDIRSSKSMQKWLQGFKHSNKIKQWHLNGSSSDMGSGKDKHEIPFSIDDKIWHGIKTEESSLAVVVKYAAEHSIPIICEINRGTESDVKNCINEIKRIL